MKKETPIAMPSNNCLVPIGKKQLFPTDPLVVETLKQLRRETGAGLHDIKEALRKADGDYDKARESLRNWSPGPLIHVTIKDNDKEIKRIINN